MLLQLLTLVTCHASLVSCGTAKEPDKEFHGSKFQQSLYQTLPNASSARKSSLRLVGRELRPRMSAEGMPECKPHIVGPSGFCEKDDSYPRQEVEKLLQNLNIRLGHTSSQRTFTDENEETDVCDHRVRIIGPQTALNSKKEWVYLVQGTTLGQVVRGEICLNPDKPCGRIAEALSYGYTSTCVQKHSKVKLLVIHPEGKEFITDEFYFPSCCVCKIQRHHFYKIYKKLKRKGR